MEHGVNAKSRALTYAIILRYFTSINCSINERRPKVHVMEKVMITF